MKKLRRSIGQKIAVGITIVLSLCIFGLGYSLRAQMQYQREFIESELVVAVHEFTQLQREVLRLNERVALFPDISAKTLQFHLDMTQSRVTIVQKRLLARHSNPQNNPEKIFLERDRILSEIVVNWSKIKPQIQSLSNSLTSKSSLDLESQMRSKKTICALLKALELEINRVALRNREHQWTQYQLFLASQTRSFNYLVIILICFFTFAILFGSYTTKFIRKKQRLLEEMRQISTTDELTQIANRRYFNQVFQQEWNRALRDEREIAIALCDVDFFKQYNDYYGHQEGDRCLYRVARMLADNLRRSNELVARYGGEEFVIIIANTSLDRMKDLSDRLRDCLKQLAIEHEKSSVSSYVTMSMGIAIGIPTLDLTPESALEFADRSLYQAKSQGRDRACFHVFNSQTKQDFNSL